tara:strand:+ start:193 stop:747 length:555 start_codon:yes stop_codon:yes gene_type:complete
MASLSRLIVITGPSGVGKGSLVEKLLQRNKHLWLSISATTRKPRDGEKDGLHYFFLEKEQFEKSIKNGGFLEWAEFAGNFYGTPKNQVQIQLDKNKIVLLEIELEGARQVRKTFPDGFQIFLAPPSFKELEKRIRGRGTDDEEAIQRRLLRAHKELKAKDEFDEVVINDDLKKAVIAIENLLNY